MNYTLKNTATTFQNTAETLFGATRDVLYAGLGVFATLSSAKAGRSSKAVRRHSPRRLWWRRKTRPARPSAR